MRSWVVLLAALLATGCLGGKAPADDPLANPGGNGIAPAIIVDPIPGATGPVDAPVWNLGDAWFVTTRDGEAPESSVLVVTDADSGSYTVATTSERFAGYDAMFDISYIGRIRASDLAGEQGGKPIRYFDFPLENGKTWTTEWDGLTVALTATQTPSGFDIVGTAEGEPYVTFDYSPAMKWFSRLDFAAGYGIKVDRTVSGWTGEVLHANARVLFESGPAAPIASPGEGSFVVEAGQTYVVISLWGGGDTWARGFALLQPDGQPYMSTTIGNFETSDGAGGFRYEERVPALEGEWRIAAPAAHDMSGGGHVVVHQVAVSSLAFS